MRGYCPTCKEYRSDAGEDAWGLAWTDGLAVCERCGSVVDVWRNRNCDAEGGKEREHSDENRKE